MKRYFLRDYLRVDDHCSHITQEMGSVDKEQTPACEKCGASTFAIVKAGQFAQGNGPVHLTGKFDKPIEMMSVALDNDAEIGDFRDRNPNVEIHSEPNHPQYGIPLAHTRKEKMNILREEGYLELN